MRSRGSRRVVFDGDLKASFGVCTQGADDLSVSYAVHVDINGLACLPKTLAKKEFEVIPRLIGISNEGASRGW